MWDRWQKGESLNEIARLFDRHHPSIQRILAETGGIRPAKRYRSRLALTLIEREEISRGVVAGNSIRSIAAVLGRSPSTVSREINRNGGNRQLKGLNPENLEFSVLEIASAIKSAEEVIERENRWKIRLGTQDFGLNDN